MSLISIIRNDNKNCVSLLLPLLLHVIHQLLDTLAKTIGCSSKGRIVEILVDGQGGTKEKLKNHHLKTSARLQSRRLWNYVFYGYYLCAVITNSSFCSPIAIFLPNSSKFLLYFCLCCLYCMHVRLMSGKKQAEMAIFAIQIFSYFPFYPVNRKMCHPF